MQTQRRNRTRRTVWLPGIIVAASIAALAGCVERKETIHISSDGAVSMDLEYRADPGEFDSPVAFPSEKSGWTVDRRSEFDHKGKETVALTSRRAFAPREALPGNFAAKGDHDAALYLQFPTTVRVERRADGTYMHFKRVYESREWAQIQYWHDLAFDDDVKKLGDKPVEEMTMAEKARVVKAFAGFELFKHMELAKRAIEKMGDRIPQDASLRARMILTSRYEDTDWEAFVDQFETPSDVDRAASEDESVTQTESDPSVAGLVKSAANKTEEAKEERTARFEAAAKQLLVESLHGAMAELAESTDLDESHMQKLHAEFANAKKAYDITESLGAHSFKIKVLMPGELVGHNGDKIDEEDGGIVWEFDGKAFRDRRFELAATVKLAGGANGQ